MQKGVDQCRINGWAIFKVMLQNEDGSFSVIQAAYQAPWRSRDQDRLERNLLVHDCARLSEKVMLCSDQLLWRRAAVPAGRQTKCMGTLCESEHLRGTPGRQHTCLPVRGLLACVLRRHGQPLWLPRRRAPCGSCPLVAAVAWLLPASLFRWLCAFGLHACSLQTRLFFLMTCLSCTI